jgi:hypothetical protein
MQIQMPDSPPIAPDRTIAGSIPAASQEAQRRMTAITTSAANFATFHQTSARLGVQRPASARGNE